MTDKELLELAAKAAGISIVWDDKWNCFMRDARPVQEFDSELLPWRPLTDDGDALRLAVKLKMRVDVVDFAVYVWTLNGIVSIKESTTMGYDIEEATRRAIVRAAAEIGKTL